MMGQPLSSCGEQRRRERRTLFGAVRDGELDVVQAIVNDGQSRSVFGRGRLSPLHVAVLTGQIEVLSMLLDRFGNPDVLTRHRQTPLMLAAMHGNISSVQTLIQAGANILMFDSLNGRTCLHYACYYGHSDCLQAILSAARSSPVAHSWGFERFVNIRDRGGNTPLHLAARKRRPECVRVLLHHGALVSASTSGNSYHGNTPLHLAARSGCLDCVRELLAHGANRLKLDSSGRIPYMVAMRHKNRTCAALLNPSAAEPLVWPSPFKFISELDPQAKTLLEKALMEANLEREKAILRNTIYSASDPSPSSSDADPDDDNNNNASDSEASNVELCCICFDQICAIEVKPCGHEMCAHCVVALCCHKKPNPRTSATTTPPLCPFCRSTISQLVVANNIKPSNERGRNKAERSRKSSFSEGSSSFKSLSAMGSFGRLCACNSGKVATESAEVVVDKP